MDDYKEIFNKRGTAYHTAMTQYPNVRDEEFKAVCKLLPVQKELVLLDIPSGGGYLKQYLPHNCTYYGLDFSEGFENNHSVIVNWTDINFDIETGSIDIVICLAAHHHMEERATFYQEVHRVLKSGGLFLIVDVLKNSSNDIFLNRFVNEWNSMGHDGSFLDLQRDTGVLIRFGYDIEIGHLDIDWRSNNDTDFLNFVRTLFYLDKEPSDIQLREALSTSYHKEIDNSVYLKWPLSYIQAKKRLSTP